MIPPLKNECYFNVHFTAPPLIKGFGSETSTTNYSQFVFNFAVKITFRA